jgi:acetylglutamate kinase
MNKPDPSQPVLRKPDRRQPDPASRRDRPVVVKLGGRVPAPAVLDDVAALAAAGSGVVLVHGGSEAIDQLAGELSVPVRTLQSPDGTSSRQTDQPMLDVVTLALLGRVKPALVRGLAARGVRAAGLSGADGGVVLAEQKTVLRAATGGRRYVVRDDLSGQVTSVRPACCGHCSTTATCRCCRRLPPPRTADCSTSTRTGLRRPSPSPSGRGLSSC